MLVAAAGCASTRPRDNFDRWANRAVSADVVADRGRAEHLADTLFTHLPVKPVAVTSADSCVVGENNMWHTDPYRFRCQLDETRYVPVDGALMPLLVKIDAAALDSGIGLTASEPLQNVQHYFAHAGRNADGNQLPKPRLVYEGGFGIVAIDWHDPAFPEATTAPTTYPIQWPVVYQTTSPAVDLPNLAAAHDNVLAIYVSQTYFELTWPNSSD